MNKIIVRDQQNEDGMVILIIADENGTILHEEYPTYDDFCAEVLADIFALSKKYAPFTLHFITEDDVNKYLALAPLSEYPAVQDEEDEEEYDECDDEYNDGYNLEYSCNSCDDTSCRKHPSHRPYDDYGYEEDGCTDSEPTVPIVTSLASLFKDLSVDGSPSFENASRD